MATIVEVFKMNQRMGFRLEVPATESMYSVHLASVPPVTNPLLLLTVGGNSGKDVVVVNNAWGLNPEVQNDASVQQNVILDFEPIIGIAQLVVSDENQNVIDAVTIDESNHHYVRRNVNVDIPETCKSRTLSDTFQDQVPLDVFLPVPKDLKECNPDATFKDNMVCCRVDGDQRHRTIGMAKKLFHSNAHLQNFCTLESFPSRDVALKACPTCSSVLETDGTFTPVLSDLSTMVNRIGTNTSMSPTSCNYCTTTLPKSKTLRESCCECGGGIVRFEHKRIDETFDPLVKHYSYRSATSWSRLIIIMTILVAGVALLFPEAA